MLHPSGSWGGDDGLIILLDVSVKVVVLLVGTILFLFYFI